MALPSYLTASHLCNWNADSVSIKDAYDYERDCGIIPPGVSIDEYGRAVMRGYHKPKLAPMVTLRFNPEPPARHAVATRSYYNKNCY